MQLEIVCKIIFFLKIFVYHKNYILPSLYSLGQNQGFR